jgi:hypothetical protein
LFDLRPAGSVEIVVAVEVVVMSCSGMDFDFGLGGRGGGTSMDEVRGGGSMRDGESG